ncbi:BatD family protein [Pseudoxanthomonas wuyuanensis]
MKRNLIVTLAILTAFWLSLPIAQAATRAWLEQPQVVLGEAVTLNIETGLASVAPDLTPLMDDFELSDQSSSRSVRLVNGQMTSRTLYAITLTPKRSGELTLPSLRVGSERTAPLTLQVTAAPAPAANGGDARVFLETVIDDAKPYVQQAVGVSVRLHYAVPLASGQLDLDTPEGALLQKIGDDITSSREINGRRYNVVERRFLLVPDRSGPMTLPAPRFVGRGAGGWMDDFLGGNSREMRAAGSARTLEVRPQPASAPQPWLPLRDLRMRYVAAPQALRAGEAATLTVEVLAVGATRAQLPDLPSPSVPGAQVFAEPAQYDESFASGTPQVRLTRRYSVVPNQAGPLLIPGPSLGWWDVRAGSARTASLPDLKLTVAAGSGSFAAPATTVPETAAIGAGGTDNALALGQEAASTTTSGPWRWLAAGFALLWLATLVWALQKRAVVRGRRTVVDAAGQHDAPAAATHSLADLKRALDGADLVEVGQALCGLAAPPARDLDALAARLQQASQRDAIEGLRRACWAGGDASAARSAIREAFRKGPVWRTVVEPEASPLPPLYPQR